MHHYDQLKKLMPIELGQVSDADMEVEGSFFDSADSRIMDLLVEIFPSTTDILLSRWEHEYGLSPRAEDSLENRRCALLARYTDVGNLSQTYFVKLAAALGYDIFITEGGEQNNMFRAGISRAGDPVYSPVLMWVWKITTLNKFPAADIINHFNDLNPPHMRLEFEDGSQ